MARGFRISPHQVALLALASGIAAQAPAAIVSGTVSFTAHGFPAGAPQDPVHGTVSFSFDNSATFFSAVNGSVQNGVPVQVSVGGLDLPGAWTPVLTYVLSGNVGGTPVQDLLSIGDALNGTQTVAGTNDWRVAFNTVSTSPSFREFTYTVVGTDQLYQTFAGNVPEPGSMALWLVGTLALGGRHWWRRCVRPGPARPLRQVN